MVYKAFTKKVLVKKGKDKKGVNMKTIKTQWRVVRWSKTGLNNANKKIIGGKFDYVLSKDEMINHSKDVLSRISKIKQIPIAHLKVIYWITIDFR